MLADIVPVRSASWVSVALLGLACSSEPAANYQPPLSQDGREGTPGEGRSAGESGDAGVSRGAEDEHDSRSASEDAGSTSSTESTDASEARPERERKDPWEYARTGYADEFGAPNAAGAGAMAPSAPGGGGASTGFAVGGANDIQNFRANIANGYLPLVSDITHEGLYYDYYFDRGQSQACETLFCPTYSQMLSTDLLTEGQEYYLSVGLSSGLNEEDVRRKRLNLVVVLDISGSMGSPFNRYYYDGERDGGAVPDKSKMEVATESIVGMLDHLKDGDRFGMVLFDNDSYVGMPLSSVEDTDMDVVAEHILALTPAGGTNMEAGFTLGTELLAEQAMASSPDEYENRVLFLTDAMPNTGSLSEDSLLGMVEANAAQRMYTTFIGIGVDFNTTLIEALTKVRGANYYSVHNEEEFNTRMDDEFEYMVTPLVFDLKLDFASEGFEIEAVYGSPEADRATGTLMHVNTLFPAASSGGQTKGGVVLLKLRRTGEDASIRLSASYADRSGERFEDEQSFELDAELDVAPNTGIQKAILLSRYVNLMQEWIMAEREEAAGAQPEDSQWERTSLPLSVSEAYKERFEVFLEGFTAEAERIGDEALDREADILRLLIDHAEE